MTRCERNHCRVALTPQRCSKCLHARTTFEGLFKQVIAQREATRDSGVVYSDFLDVLVNSRYKDGNALSISEITGVMMGVLLGGQHTSNVTGAWLLLHLLQNKPWLEAVLAEQLRVVGTLDPAVQLTMDHVTELHVLQQCLDETLRLHPPFFQLVRKVMRDMDYRGTIIPEGRLVAISPAALQRLPQYYERPNEFDPSRFAPENKDKIVKHAWVPFGGGRHQCTGKKVSDGAAAASGRRTVCSFLGVRAFMC